LFSKRTVSDFDTNPSRRLNIKSGMVVTEKPASFRPTKEQGSEPDDPVDTVFIGETLFIHFGSELALASTLWSIVVLSFSAILGTTPAYSILSWTRGC